MPVPTRITDLSATAASNSPAGTDTISTTLDDYLRGIQQVVRGDLAHKGADIASASTTDLGAVAGLMHDITGSTSITSFGTVSAGVWKVVKFEGALTLTHNATSLILPGAANITTADGDVGVFISEGSGNWRCLSFVKAAGGVLGPVLATEQASTSGTSIDFTGIPSWAKRITIMFDGVSTNGTSNLLVQLGDAGGIEATGYAGRGSQLANAASVSASDFTTGMGIASATATHTINGSVVITLMDAANNTWVMTGTLCTTATTVAMYLSAAVKSLSAALDRVRVTTVNGTDTFDAGALNIIYE